MNGVVLVAGAGGFLGGHLVEALDGAWDVVGVGRSKAPENLSEVSTVCWLRCKDSTEGLAEAARSVRPDLVVNAAFVNRKPADQSDHEFLASNQGVHLALFEACAEMDIPVLLTSSSAVYGEGDGQAALTEASPRRPVSLYGLAKTQQELQAEHVHRSRGLRLCIARLFNLLGPGRGLGTVVHDWVSQIAAFPRHDAREEPPTLTVRNRETARDFVDPRDAAGALALLADRIAGRCDDSIRGESLGGDSLEIFNVASGRSVSLRELDAYLQELSSRHYEVIETHPSPGKADAKAQRGDAGRLRRACGWQPQTDWRQSVRDVWEQYTDSASPEAQRETE